MSITRMVGKRLARFLAKPRPSRTHVPTSPREVIAATLRKGDVVLVEGTSRFSSAIKYLTQSTWSHAALYIGDTMGAGAEGQEANVLCDVDVNDGVRVIPLSTFSDLHTRILPPGRAGRRGDRPADRIHGDAGRQQLRPQEHHGPGALPGPHTGAGPDEAAHARARQRPADPGHLLDADRAGLRLAQLLRSSPKVELIEPTTPGRARPGGMPSPHHTRHRQPVRAARPRSWPYRGRQPCRRIEGGVGSSRRCRAMTMWRQPCCRHQRETPLPDELATT